MWQTFILTSEIEKTVRVNKLIFWLGKIFGKAEYENYGIKRKLAFFALVFDFMKKFLTTIFIFAVSIGYPLFLIWNSKTNIEKYNCFMHLFVCFYIFWGCLANSALFRTDENKFIYIKLMRMDAKKYVFSQFIIKRTFEIICEILIFGAISYFLSGYIWPILMLIFAKYIFRCFGELLHLILYKKTGKIFERSPLEYFVLLAITSLIAYLPPILNILPVYSTNIMLVLALGLILFGILGFLYMINFHDYYSVVIGVTKAKNIKLSSEDLKNIRTASISLKDTNLTSLQINKLNKKHGFDYFNTIFFERFKTDFHKSLKTKIFVISILFIFCLCLSILISDFKSNYNSFVLKYSYIIIYALFTIFNQDKFTKMMFYNCDLPLLKYRLYTNDGSIYLGFKQRVKKLLVLNLIPAFLITLAFLILESIFFQKISMDILLFSIFVILISVFLTVNSLSLYYLLQPYSSSIEVKNYAYNYIPNLFMFSLVILLSMKVLSLQVFLITFLILLAVCLPILPVLVKKFSSKTFKIKN